jgi:hypothetical protein
MLKNIQIGWVWLERTLNGIIDAVNAQHIIPSASVAVQEAPNGVVLTVAKGGGDGGGGPTEGGWLTVTIVDPQTCAQSTVQVWAK